MRIVAGAMAIVLLTLGGGTPAGAVSKAQLKSKALSISNFPTGWSVDNSSGGGGSEPGCLAGLKSSFKHEVKVDVSFTNGDLPSVQETIETGPRIGGRYLAFVKATSKCKQISFTSSGQNVTGTAGAMSFPKVGNRSSAFAFSLKDQGESVGLDVLFFQIGQLIGEVEYTDLGSPDPDQFQAYVTEAISKIEGKATVTPTTF
jgi:hypothetical protein